MCTYIKSSFKHHALVEMCSTNIYPKCLFYNIVHTMQQGQTKNISSHNQIFKVIAWQIEKFIRQLKKDLKKIGRAVGPISPKWTALLIITFSTLGLWPFQNETLQLQLSHMSGFSNICKKKPVLGQLGYFFTFLPLCRLNKKCNGQFREKKKVHPSPRQIIGCWSIYFGDWNLQKYCCKPYCDKWCKVSTKYSVCNKVAIFSS